MLELPQTCRIRPRLKARISSPLLCWSANAWRMVACRCGSVVGGVACPLCHPRDPQVPPYPPGPGVCGEPALSWPADWVSPPSVRHPARRRMPPQRRQQPPALGAIVAGIAECSLHMWGLCEVLWKGRLGCLGLRLQTSAGWRGHPDPRFLFRIKEEVGGGDIPERIRAAARLWHSVWGTSR
jgi:hypothetical protein